LREALGTSMACPCYRLRAPQLERTPVEFVGS
jgi:hypothetical protein